MSMFYRPGDSSSDDEEDSENEVDEVSMDEITDDSAKDSTGTAEDLIGAELTATESLSTNDFSLTNSTGEDGQVTSQDDHRSMMLATMLEELTKYKAAEMLNQAHAGTGIIYDKNSPEVQTFAKNLFQQSSGVLNQQGWLPPEATSEQRSSLRQQYLTTFNAIGARHADLVNRPDLDKRRSSTEFIGNALVRRSQQPISFQAAAAGQMSQLNWEMSNMNIVRRPSAELQLSTPIHFRSHYRSTFEERGLLGKGGFGRVYHTFNIFDRQEYAIKKIPLSQKLSHKYRQGGHQELSQILREVQALARLDHCNVVRYHATWIEEPVSFTENLAFPRAIPDQRLLSHRGQLLLDHKPATQNSPPKVSTRFSLVDEDDDIFERNDNDNDDISKQLWSDHPLTPSIVHSGDNSNPFTDGGSRSRLHQGSPKSDRDDPSVYVLHVQMSMCQTTLSEYILPATSTSPRSNKHHSLSSSSSTASPPRHCFHLIPALRILLSILCGLQYIHARGFVHRDIKPSNIFLSTVAFASPEAFSDGGYIDIGSCPSCINPSPRFVNPRIGDFGLVTDLERLAAADASTQSRSRSSSASTKAVGTEYYRPPPFPSSPPKQKRGGSPPRSDPPNEKLDVFALGVIFLELLWSCGTRMERIELLRACQEGAVPLRIKEKLEEHGTSREIVEMVEACARGMIDPDPKSRWRCAMVKSAVEAILRKVQEM